MTPLRRAACWAVAFLCLLVLPTAALAQLAPIVADSTSVGINIATATTTELVPLVAGKKTYVTYAHIEAAGTGNITFVYGTGTACATGTTAIGGAISWTAQTGFSGGSGVGPILTVPAGKALCATTSAAVQMSGWLTYAQY